MIDVEKYDGHTPAPWKAMDENPERTAGTGPYERREPIEHDAWWVELNEARCNTHSGQWQRRIGATYMTMRDAQLIADAPLILEDYKRLTDIIADYRRFHTWVSEKHYEVIEEWEGEEE